MPVNMVHCSSRAKGKGTYEVLEIDKCAACAASGKAPCQMPAPMVRMIHAAWKDSASRNPFSASKMGSCPRKAILEQKFAWGADPKTQYASLRGTITHAAMESFVDQDNDELSEVRYKRKFAGVTIGGQFDFVDQKRGILYDYKSVAKLPPFQYSYIGHKIQGNIYRWLLANEGIDIKEIFMVYISMEGWKLGIAKLMDFSEIEDIIKRFVNAVKPALDAGEDWQDYLPEVLPYDNWQCGYCDLKKACYSLKDQQLIIGSMDDDDDDDTF